jgi:hypothetical protein
VNRLALGKLESLHCLETRMYSSRWTSCVLLTAATATQLGYLVVVVEDFCADLPSVHDRVMRSYHAFMFAIARSYRIREDRP